MGPGGLTAAAHFSNDEPGHAHVQSAHDPPPGDSRDTKRVVLGTWARTEYVERMPSDQFAPIGGASTEAVALAPDQ